ncbi:hypothetical protein AGMMS50212_11690 [Spirochaetia bacterium]|nr:hypothetical protein AGMMS50212_11690 [Spirochaetia bacterium]
MMPVPQSIIQEEPNYISAFEEVNPLEIRSSAMNPLAPDVVLTKNDRGRQVVESLSKAYPKIIKDFAFIDGDWAVKLRGNWYYYADGKFLPETARESAAKYSPQPFYPYPKKLPAWEPPSIEDAARMIAASKQRRSGAVSNRSLFFFDELWNIRSRAEAWDQVKSIHFLGQEILVHHVILEELALVEQLINKAAKTDKEVKLWLSNIDSITSWNWRNIADVQSRSNHAYGIAIDLVSRNPKKLETYWLWTLQNNIDFWDVPYSKRIHPPDAVIEAFEAYGFIWGGKWSFYDTMHFEYRPEILLLNNIPLTGEY